MRGLNLEANIVDIHELYTFFSCMTLGLASLGCMQIATKSLGDTHENLLDKS
jgi:hypothetical protein